MTLSLRESIQGRPAIDATRRTWSYEQAFARNLGLLTPAEQARVHGSRIAIPGMGGVGGVHLLTLARLGIGAFHIADPDAFNTVNFNRQNGATTETLGRNKAKVMAEKAALINPEISLRVFPDKVHARNIDAFLDGVDVVVDGIDFFAIEDRRLLYREARRRGLWVVTAGPIGFSTAWMSFAPDGMSFDEYFDLSDTTDRWAQIIAFAVGLTPRATHLAYMDLSKVDKDSGAAPSAGLACQLCGGVATTEVLKILLGRQPIQAAPWSFQFDAYRHILRKTHLRWGNRHPWQRLKRWLLRRRIAG